jgi:hypothetical protein
MKIYINDKLRKEIIQYGKGSSFSEKAVELIRSELVKRKK